MVEQIAGGKPLPDDVARADRRRTDGVPLFVEELTKSVLESGRTAGDGGPLRPRRPAAAVRHSDDAAGFADGAARPLGAGQEIAQIGAAIGREFTYD